MRQQGNRIGEVPLLLTVEEAGELLRIGRTKAYAMTREWRETNGASGLPVVDLGNILRVPRSALEQLIGADLSRASASETETNVSVERAQTTISPPLSRRPRRSTPQPDLFASTRDPEAS